MRHSSLCNPGNTTQFDKFGVETRPPCVVSLSVINVKIQSVNAIYDTAY